MYLTNMGLGNEDVTVLESCKASPPPAKVSEMSLPLTVSDIIWISFPHPTQCLLFYQRPISKSSFVDTIMPKLKISLSRALQNFHMLTGHLIIPSDSSSKPEIRYTAGNSIPLTFSESSFQDFDYLVSDQPRSCSDFYPLIPQLPQIQESDLVPLLALQVTLFPGIGISIGISWQHVLADGNSIISFMKSWAKFCKFGEDESPPPFHDRSVMKNTREIDNNAWKLFRNNNLHKKNAESPQAPLHIDMVRGTFVVEEEDVVKLKNKAAHGQSQPKHISSFTVVCGFTWTCMIKAANASSENVDEEESENFGFMADIRGRVDISVPSNYFGNCLVAGLVDGKNKELCGEGGFNVATELIGEEISKLVDNEGAILKGLERMCLACFEIKERKFRKFLTVAGSPRQNYYELDFGWGKARKFEFVSIDTTRAMSLCGCRDSRGIEIGLSLPIKVMEVFTRFFVEGLKAL